MPEKEKGGEKTNFYLLLFHNSVMHNHITTSIFKSFHDLMFSLLSNQNTYMNIKFTYMFAFSHTHIHTYTCMYKYFHTYVHTHMYIHVRIHTDTHKYLHTLQH